MMKNSLKIFPFLLLVLLLPENRPLSLENNDYTIKQLKVKEGLS